MNSLSFAVIIITIIVLLLFSQVYVSDDWKGLEPLFYCFLIFIIGVSIANHIDKL
jgi:hypothetical protein